MRPFLTLHHPSQARQYYEQRLWQQETFYGLLARHAERRPRAVAVQDGRASVTWLQLREWVDSVGADLRMQGLVAGDRLSVWMSNRIEAIVVFLACSREGIACNPSLHRSHTCAEVGELLEHLAVRAVVTEPGWGGEGATADLDAILSRIASLRVVYTLETLPKQRPSTNPPSDDPDSIAYLAFTSGTTGAPKCVMHSSNTLLANARDLVRDWRHGPDTVLLTLSPLSHHVAWVAVSQWLLLGCHLVTNDRPRNTSILHWITETGATYVMGVPTHGIDVLAEQARERLPSLGRVRVFYMAGAPIPPLVADAFLQQGITPQNVYGMTENSSHQYTHPDDDHDTIVSTCGRGGRAYEVRLFEPDDPDRPVPDGKIGHIGGRGAALMLGYFGNQAVTEASFNRSGWFMSGDLGVMSAKGTLRIEGRLKDVIIRGGHNIYPARIEALAIKHKGVLKAACFPIADRRLGERVCVAVVGSIAPDQLMEHLALEGLSRHDMPEYFLRIDEMPLTASGKVLKRELVELVKGGDLRPMAIDVLASTGETPA